MKIKLQLNFMFSKMWEKVGNHKDNFKNKRSRNE